MDCKFEENCSLREIAPDLTGCTGHSKERDKLDDEVKCSTCGKLVKESKSFKHKCKNIWTCFKCY